MTHMEFEMRVTRFAIDLANEHDLLHPGETVVVRAKRVDDGGRESITGSFKNENLGSDNIDSLDLKKSALNRLEEVGITLLSEIADRCAWIYVSSDRRWEENATRNNHPYFVFPVLKSDSTIGAASIKRFASGGNHDLFHALDEKGITLRSFRVQQDFEDWCNVDSIEPFPGYLPG
ncbi:hypothetical protein N9L18_01260 [Candidatus Pacebacteria bacterium]|nr:hypothetical protein [Candidatus Paceibacterota bacterium]